MRVVVIEGPLPAVSYEEAARHLRLDGDEERDYVEALLAVAQHHLDGPPGWLGRAIGVQTLELQAEAWQDSAPLPYPPEIDIIGVWYTDAAGVEHEWPILETLYRDRLPAVRGRMGDVRIRYRAGYSKWEGEGDDRRLITNAPAPIKHAILLLVGHWYANREAVNVGDIVSTMPFAVDALLAPYRMYA